MYYRALRKCLEPYCASSSETSCNHQIKQPSLRKVGYYVLMQEYVKRFGKEPAPQEQVDLVIQLMNEGKTQKQVLADDRVALKTTKVYEIFRYNKKANPDRSAISSPADMENGGLESPQFTVTA